MNRLRRSIGIVAATVAVVSACSLAQDHGYVQSTDGSLSFRHPAEWSSVEIEPVGLEWIAGIDGSDAPHQDNINVPVLEAPFVVAHVYQLESEVRDDATLQSLRQLSLAERSESTAEDDPSFRLLLDDVVIDENGFQGHHLRFEVDSTDGTAVEEHYAVFDPDRSRIHRLFVTCSRSCFEANRSDIDDVFGSVRLRQ